MAYIILEDALVVRENPPGSEINISVRDALGVVLSKMLPATLRVGRCSVKIDLAVRVSRRRGRISYPDEALGVFAYALAAATGSDVVVLESQHGKLVLLNRALWLLPSMVKNVAAVFEVHGSRQLLEATAKVLTNVPSITHTPVVGNVSIFTTLRGDAKAKLCNIIRPASVFPDACDRDYRVVFVRDNVLGDYRRSGPLFIWDVSCELPTRLLTYSLEYHRLCECVEGEYKWQVVVYFRIK